MQNNISRVDHVLAKPEKRVQNVAGFSRNPLGVLGFPENAFLQPLQKSGFGKGGVRSAHNRCASNAAHC